AAAAVPGTHPALDLALRPRRSLQRAPGDRVHDSGGVRIARIPRPAWRRAVPGGRTAGRMDGRRGWRGRRRRGRAAGTPVRQGRVDRSLAPRGDAPRVDDLRRPALSTAWRARVRRAGADRGDTVDRTDDGWLGRILYRLGTAVRRLSR